MKAPDVVGLLQADASQPSDHRVSYLASGGARSGDHSANPLPDRLLVRLLSALIQRDFTIKAQDRLGQNLPAAPLYHLTNQVLLTRQVTEVLPDTPTGLSFCIDLFGLL